MSKLSHSNEPTMDEIERRNLIENGEITRVQWFNYGDHPAVERPKEAHLQPVAGMKNVGILKTPDGEVLVREGDWIETYPDGTHRSR